MQPIDPKYRPSKKRPSLIILCGLIYLCVSQTVVASFSQQSQSNTNKPATDADSSDPVKPDLIQVPELPNIHLQPSVQLQDVSIDRNDLLFTNFAKPTQAAAIVDAEQSSLVKLFTVRTPTQMEYNSPIFYEQPGAFNYGATIDAEISNPVSISAGYIGGNNYWDRTEEHLNNIQTFQANSWNIAANTRWLDRSVTTKVEYAQSEQETGWNEWSRDNTAGEALYAEMRFSSDGALGAGWLDYWSSQLQYRSISPQYYSLGNWELDRGEELRRFNIQTVLNGLNMEMEWQQFCQCATPELARNASVFDRKGIRFNYDFNRLEDYPYFLQIVGTPKLGARYYHQGEKEAKAAARDKGYGLNGEANEIGINLQLANDFWAWNFDYQVTQRDQHYDILALSTPPDTPSNWLHEATLVQLAFRPTERLSLNMNAQWSQQSESMRENRYLSRNYWVEAHFDVLPDTLSLFMKYDYGFQAHELGFNEPDPMDFRSYYGNAQMSWHATKLKGQRPAIDVYLKSSVRRQLDIANENEQLDWSAHLGIEMRWADSSQ